MGAYENAVIEEGSRDELVREFLRALENETRLTKELEASRQREAKARREMEIFLDACLTGAVGDDRSRWPTTPHDEAIRRFAGAIRALKSTHESNTQGGGHG